jgi:NAD-dependent SIR2 family protein deacetylase
MNIHEGTGVADFRCNKCGKIYQRDLGWKTWHPSFCEKTGQDARLYRISDPVQKDILKLYNEAKPIDEIDVASMLEEWKNADDLLSLYGPL